MALQAHTETSDGASTSVTAIRQDESKYYP